MNNHSNTNGNRGDNHGEKLLRGIAAAGFRSVAATGSGAAIGTLLLPGVGTLAGAALGGALGGVYHVLNPPD
jgi:hypothetical protein